MKLVLLQDESGKMNYSLLTILLLVGVVSLTPYSFATIGAGEEYEPTQPNALVSYNNGTNQIQVSWDFTATGAPTTCLLKGDVNYVLDENIGNNIDITKSFIPLNYAVTQNAVPIPSIDSPIRYVETIPCAGDMRIDIDTIMNHSANVNNYSDLEIFLTFYAPNANGNFDAHNEYIIDEVFVMYSPTHVFTQPTYQGYGCNAQIGNVIYIDASGSSNSIIAHSDNGDNCGDHIYIENDQHVDIGMVDSGIDGTGHGTVTYGYHNELFSLLISTIQNIISSIEKIISGSGCDDCTPPTLGYDKDGNQLVTNGFSYNGNPVDVEYYYTPYPLITVNVGESNIAEFKIYENSGIHNIRHLDFAFGLADGEILSESNAMIEYDIDWQGNGTINIVDPHNAIEDDSVSVETETIQCTDVSQYDCMLIRIYHTFRAPLPFDIVATNVWDYKRNAWQNYYNHGIHIDGESLNPKEDILVNDNTLSLYPLIDGSNHIKFMKDDSNKVYVMSHDGFYYLKTNQYSLYHEVDESRYIRADDSQLGYERGTVEFTQYKEQHMEDIQLILDEMLGGKSIHNPDFENSAFVAGSEIKFTARADDQILQKRITLEQQRASELFDTLYN